MQRRTALVSAGLQALGLLAAPGAVRAAAADAPVRQALRFPRDFGSHPEARTEWWYITGHARGGDGGAREFGFQVTFFRSRVDATQAMRSAFAARQLVFAHAALTDLQGRRLLHDQRIARAGMGVAAAREEDTDVHLRDWSLRRDARDGSYAARIVAEAFTLELRCAPTQPLLLQGDAGLSRKGAAADETSHYYSEPQLQVSGRIALQAGAGRLELPAQGRAWLDHEWSETYMSSQAVGWDWIGMNLADGGALMAFRMRDRAGGTVWAGGSWRAGGAGSTARAFGPDDVRFEPGRRWQSPATQASYPVEWTVSTPAGRFTVRALLDNQELDSSQSTGVVYWEGLSELLDERGAPVGRGYLEMTGYAKSLRL